MAPNKDELKGRVKEASGSLSGDKSLKQEGKVDQAAGKAKQTIDKLAGKAKGEVRKGS